MVIKIPSSETLENVNRYTKSLLKPFRSCSTYTPFRDQVAGVFPSFGLAELTQCATSKQGTGCLFSAGLRIGRKHLNLK